MAKSICSCLVIGFMKPFLDCTASMIFSRMLKSPIRPSRFRSSGQNAMLAFIASKGLVRFNFSPSRMTSPLTIRLAPNNISAVSVLPLPRRPAKPRSSPFLSVSDISLMCDESPICEACNVIFESSFTSALLRLNITSISLPTIFVTSSTLLISSMLNVPTR